MANEVCLCGFVESQHLGPLLLSEIETPEDIEIAMLVMAKRQAYFLEFGLIYGSMPCETYRRDNLKYLERLSNAK